MLKILVITKRQYMNKDLLDDRFGRFREMPLELALKKYRVYGLCLSYQSKKEGKMSDGPVDWESINAGPLKLPGLLRFFKRASQLAAKADVIWACSDSIYGIIGYILALKFRIPLIFDLYDNFEYFLLARLPVIKQLYRRVIKNCDAVICASHPLARLVNSYRNTGHIFVIENAVREDLFRPLDKKTCRDALGLPQNVRLIGTAGALYRNRGIQFLFQAFDLLSAKHPDLDLAIAGSRNIHIPRNNRIHDLGILPLEKVPLLLNALDVAIICNRKNDFGKYCFPQKTREIMACDVPLISARVGSMAELFTNHPEWLFAPDDPSDLARVLENRMMNQRTNYEEVFSWSDVATELETIFLEICKD